MLHSFSIALKINRFLMILIFSLSWKLWPHWLIPVGEEQRSCCSSGAHRCSQPTCSTLAFCKALVGGGVVTFELYSRYVYVLCDPHTVSYIVTGNQYINNFRKVKCVYILAYNLRFFQPCMCSDNPFFLKRVTSFLIATQTVFLHVGAVF